MTNYSRSVLKSNGPHRSKNLPVKFGFSSKTVSANISKKLPPQRCPKPLFIAFFNFSYKWPMFAFTGESGYTLGFRRKIAHKRLHAETGAFPLRSQRCLVLPEKSSRKNSRRKWMHACGVCPLSPASRPRWAAGTYSFVTAWSFLHRYQSGQQLEFSIKTIRRPTVHCKTECILLQYSEKSLEWRRYTICPLSLFAMTLRK